MSSATVTRADALVRRIASLDGDPARREAVALGLVDGVLEGDGETLAAALDGLRDARARAAGDQERVGWLDAAIAFAHWGVERVPSRAAVAQGTQAHDFLRVLDGSPQLGSAALRRLLEVDETQVSRTGRRLLEGGLVTRQKVGREVFWHLTPRGERALEDAPAPSSDFWREALRRGFEAASGDMPGERRVVDPTREHIIVCTLELHMDRGIRATTWEEIAAKSGVTVETVRALWPTLDDLTRSCGRHFMESLQLPPADRVSEVFGGASSEHDRIHRLVETVFGAYERGGKGMAVARRERTHVAAADESLRELDNTFDALVVEALRPQRADVTSLRALTDLEVWRTLRDQGASPDAAVDRASAAVERWLDARPPR